MKALEPFCRTIAAALLVTGAALAQDSRSIKVTAARADNGAVSGAIGGQEVSLGRYHALLIGIDAYQHPEFAPRLHTPGSDVSNVRDLLIRSYGFSDASVKLLLDAQATRAGILAALASYRDAPLGPGDNLLIYFAGHGFQQPGTEDGFWIPVDGTPEESSWVPVTEIRRILKNIKARHTLLVSDSCFAGTLTRSTITLPATDRYLAEVARKDSFQVITSGGLEPVADGGREGLSLFAYSFTSCLKNQARPYLTTAQLYADLAPMVSNASGSRQTPESGRIPGTFDQNGQFVFARVDFKGSVPPPAAAQPAAAAPAPASTLVPGAPSSLEAPRASFLDISFANLPGWNLSINQPGEKLQYTHDGTGVTLVLTSFLQDGAANLTNDLQASLDIISKNMVSSMKKQGFKSTVLEDSSCRKVGDLAMFTVLLALEMGPVKLFSETELVVDPKGSRIYTFTITGSPSAKSVGLEARNTIQSSVRRTAP